MKAISPNESWFSFKGIRNDSLDVRLLSMPTRPHPARKGEFKEIPGKNGSVWQDQGAYENIVIPVHCIAPDNDKIDGVNAWLSAEGDLIFGDEPSRAYHAIVVQNFDRSNRSQFLRGQEFTVSFDCGPFRYEASPVADISIGTTGTAIINPGTWASAPLLTINGTGDGTLMIGNDTLIFNDLAGYIVVDCDAKIAYTGGTSDTDPIVLATQHLTGDWPQIQPGTSFVSFTGGIQSVVITPRWRWL